MMSNASASSTILDHHPAVRMMFKVRNTRTLNDQLSSWTSKARMVLEYLLWRSGPLTIPPALVNAFVKSHPSRDTPDLQYVVYPLTYDTVGEPAHKFSAFTASICLVQPQSLGSVRITSGDPAIHPEIRLNFLTNVIDVQAAIAGMRGIRRICNADALKPYEKRMAEGALLETRKKISNRGHQPNEGDHERAAETRSGSTWRQSDVPSGQCLADATIIRQGPGDRSSLDYLFPGHHPSKASPLQSLVWQEDGSAATKNSSSGFHSTVL
jgi:choline dehydrogenase-like flavoprotein